jgi:hypothetical protein
MSFRTKLWTLIPASVLLAVLAGPPAGAATQLATWGTVPSPNRGHLENALFGVSAVTQDDVWAVGEYNPGLPPTVTGRQTLSEHWDGTAWQIVRSPNTSFTGVDASYLKDVDAAASNDVWAVGFGEDFASFRSKTLTIHWNGSDWTKVRSPNPSGRTSRNDLYAVKAISSTNVLAIGDTGFPGTALILRWDGSAWAKVRNGCGVGLKGIDALSANDVWTVGSSTTCHFDGSAWRVIPSPQPRPAYDEVAYSLVDVSVLSPNDVWVSGTRTIQQGDYSLTFPLVERWNGTAWTAMYNVPGVSLNGIHALAANDVYSVGTDSTYPTVTHFDGSGWTPVPSPRDGGGALKDIDITPVTNGLWAVGAAYTGPHPGTLVEQAPSATQGTVVGNTAVAGATVTWIGPENGSTETDVSGDYFAAGLIAGEYQFIASNPGCVPASVQVTVVAGQTITRDLDLNCS